jgi:hypothetical protein
MPVKINHLTASRLEKPIQKLEFEEKYSSLDIYDPLTILSEKEDAYENARKYAKLWNHLTGHFTAVERRMIIDYYVKCLTIRKLNKKYGINCFKIIEKVEKYLLDH